MNFYVCSKSFRSFQATAVPYSTAVLVNEHNQGWVHLSPVDLLVVPQSVRERSSVPSASRSVLISPCRSWCVGKPVLYVILRTLPCLDHRFMCVGTWIENFHTYFVTRLVQSKQRSRTSNNQYACFVSQPTAHSIIASSFSAAILDEPTVVLDLAAEHGHGRFVP